MGNKPFDPNSLQSIYENLDGLNLFIASLSGVLPGMDPSEPGKEATATSMFRLPGIEGLMGLTDAPSGGLSMLESEWSRGEAEPIKPVNIRFGFGCEACGKLFYGTCDFNRARRFRNTHSEDEVAGFKLVFDQKVDQWNKQRAKARDAKKRQAKKTEQMMPVVLKLLEKPEIQAAIRNLLPKEGPRSSGSVNYDYIESIVSRVMARNNPTVASQTAQSIKMLVRDALREHDRELKEEIRNNRWDRRLSRWWKNKQYQDQIYWDGWSSSVAIDNFVTTWLTRENRPDFSKDLAIKLAEKGYYAQCVKGWADYHFWTGWKGVKNLFFAKLIQMAENENAAFDMIQKRIAEKERYFKDMVAKNEELLVKILKHDDLTTEEQETLTALKVDNETLQMALDEVSKKFWDDIVIKVWSGLNREQWELEIWSRIPGDVERKMVERLKAEGKIPTEKESEQPEAVQTEEPEPTPTVAPEPETEPTSSNAADEPAPEPIVVPLAEADTPAEPEKEPSPEGTPETQEGTKQA
jgi:hypothetical protein